jgi:CubicO group peptidase (beta-lactamase class C family)
VSSPAEALGAVSSGFETVADEFRRILDESPTSGAAFAAVAGGETLVDLWGGVADEGSGTPWREDTIQLVFSGTKGLVATCLLILLDRGSLSLDAPVSRYWPEFAAAGKQNVTVRQVVSHTAGVPGLRDGFRPADLLDGARMSERVAREAPYWPPGTELAYHALTYGWICDALVRRIDGRSLGRFFADEVAEPFGLELWIGLPPELEPRVARLAPASDFAITYAGDEPEPLIETIFGGLLDQPFRWNEPEFHAAEIPAANAIGAARGIARLYGCLACGGELDGVRLVSKETVRIRRSELARGTCAVTGRPYAFGVGFELQTELARFGPPADAFGHTGSGGSSHGGWPEAGVGFSFAMNELWPEARDDRAMRLLSALAKAL